MCVVMCDSNRNYSISPRLTKTSTLTKLKSLLVTLKNVTCKTRNKKRLFTITRSLSLHLLAD